MYRILLSVRRRYICLNLLLKVSVFRSGFVGGNCKHYISVEWLTNTLFSRGISSMLQIQHTHMRVKLEYIIAIVIKLCSALKIV